MQKIGIPDQSGLIQRAHLRQALADVMNKRVTLLRAPTGCGKTSLASQIAHEVPADVLWLTLTSYIQDQPTFYQRFFQLLNRLIPDLPVLHSNFQQHETVAHDMAQSIAETFREPLLIVLDDWHVLGAHHHATLWLNTFIEAMPANCHILLTSRTQPALKSVKLVATKQILAIPQDELFFTEAELYMLATRLNPGKPVDQQALHTIWESMRGWPAGTVLALQPSSSSVVLELTEGMQPSEVLFQEVARDILQYQTPDVQHFLKWSSTLDIFTPDSLEMIYGIGDWAATLADIQQQNLFLFQDSSGYRYHHLFRTFLQNHFRLNNPADYHASHRRAAAWYQVQGSFDRAIDHYVQANAIDQAVQLVESLVYVYFVQGRIETLRQFRTMLASIDLPTPHLDHISAKILLDFEQNPEQALAHANRALAHFQSTGETSWTLETTIQRAEILMRQARFQDALTIFQQVYDHPEARPIQRGNARMRMGTCKLLLTDYQQAVNWLEESLPLLEQYAGMYDRSLALQSLEIAYRAIGKTDDANLCLHRLVDLRRQLDNPEALASALNNLGYRYYEQGHIKAARETFDQGLEVVRFLHSSSSRYHLYSSYADLERDLGFFDQARDYYQRALALVDNRDPAARCEMLLHLAQLYRWQARQEAALTCAEEALELARKHSMDALVIQARIIIYDIQLQSHSARNIDHALRTMPDGGAPILLAVLRLRVAQMQQQETVYHSILTDLQNQYCKGISIQPFFAEAVNNPQIAGLVQAYPSRYGHLLNALNHLRQFMNGTTENPIIHLDVPVHYLQCYAFNTLMIRRDGKAISERDWNSPPVRELLYYLIFHKAISLEAFGQLYWPDQAKDKMGYSFAAVLARLRNAVGMQTILYDNNESRYHLNPHVRIWCDALRVETLSSEASRLSPDNPRAYDAWYQVTQLYNGDFLPEFDRDWIVARRSHYRNLAIQAWHGLATFHSKQHNYHSAVSAYDSAKELDPTYESTYREQMLCWSMLGEKARITRVYEELKDLLHREYKTAPSRATRQLYLQLVR